MTRGGGGDEEVMEKENSQPEEPEEVLEDKEEEPRTEGRVLTCVSVRQDQAVGVSFFSGSPSESACKLISPSFAEMKQTSDSCINCRVTDLRSDDSDAAYSTRQSVDRIKK